MKSDATSRLRRLAAQAQQLQGVREQRGGEVAQPNILADCFPEQLAFIRDQSPLKAALTTRRAAKSYSIGLWFIDDSFSHPGANYLFLGLSREEASRIFWKDVLKDIDQRHGLGMRFNESRLVATMPNGAQILILGADTSLKEKEKLLGGKYRHCAIDEAGSWTQDVETIIQGKLGPAVTDHEGSIALIGTPSNLIFSYFARVSRGCRAGYVSPPEQREPGWSVHSWDTSRNPFMAKQWARKIAQLRETNERITETPWFRQNYLGEWVTDLSALCYQYDPARNNFTELPSYSHGRSSWALGVDLGYEDASAFVLVGWHEHDPHLYITEAWKRPHMTLSEVAEVIRGYQSRVSLDAIVIDGSAKQAVMDMCSRYDLPLQAAEKPEKAEHITIMSDALTQGLVLVNPDTCGDLITEWSGLVWDERALRDLNKRKELAACDNHAADAALYAFRKTFAYLATPAPPPRPAPGTSAWAEAEMERMWSAEAAQINAKRDEEKEGLGSSESWEDWAKAGR